MAGLLVSGSLHADETEMEKGMGEVSDSLKQLRKIDKGDHAAAAALVRKAHIALSKTMLYVPIVVKEMKDGVEKDKALADSRMILGQSYVALCELELAYLEGDDAKIKAAADKVKATKKDGHKKYTDD